MAKDFGRHETARLVTDIVSCFNDPLCALEVFCPELVEIGRLISKSK